MGNCNSRQPHGSDRDDGLLPIDNLIDQRLNIENLIFQDGRSRAYAYVGAVKVLEKVGILGNIRRVSGVGTGAIVATLLACRFHCENLQRSLLPLLDELVVGDPTSYPDYKPNIVRKLGWNPGDKLYEMLGNILSNTCNKADLTFLELYENTSIELCVVVTNVNAMRAEYWHRKTAPDMIIREAVYMSLSLPVMFCPKQSSKYCSEDSKSVYVTGSLLCSNPIHTFDGWWLSMNPEDDYFIRLGYIPRSWSDKDKFDTWNPKSLGFMLLSKRDEKVYPEFSNRLAKVGATCKIPNTELGKKYKKSLKLQDQIEQNYETVTQATKKLLSIIEECLHGTRPFEQSLAERITKNSPLSSKEQILLFSKHLTKIEDCIAFFKEIADGHQLTPPMLMAYIQRVALGMLHDYTSVFGEEVNDMCSFLGNVVQTMNVNTNTINENDQKRTVGIFYCHIDNNTFLEPGDQTFLYKQGWNATVAYLSQRENIDKLAVQINSNLNSNLM